jgi:hypothetical protein
LVEDFDDLDFAHIQTESSRHRHSMNFVGIDCDTHAFVSVEDGGRLLVLTPAQEKSSPV